MISKEELTRDCSVIRERERKSIKPREEDSFQEGVVICVRDCCKVR